MELIAHRGGRGFGTDNTLQAMEAAASAGVRYIETDLRLTADGQMLVCHDAIIANHIVSRTPYDLLRQHAPERPLLGEVLESLAGWVRFDLEIKKAPPRAVCDAIRSYNIELDTLVTSFDIDILGDFKTLCPEVRTGLLFRSPFNINKKRNVADAVGAEVLAPHYPNVDGEFMKQARDAGLEVIAWTVNEVDELKKLVNLGVDGIVTDRYLEFEKALKEMGSNPGDGPSASRRRSRR